MRAVMRGINFLKSYFKTALSVWIATINWVGVKRFERSNARTSRICGLSELQGSLNPPADPGGIQTNPSTQEQNATVQRTIRPESSGPFVTLNGVRL